MEFSGGRAATQSGVQVLHPTSTKLNTAVAAQEGALPFLVFVSGHFHSDNSKDKLSS